MPSSSGWRASSIVMGSPPLEPRRPLSQESGSAFLLILGAGAEPEERRLQCQTLGLTGIQALVHRLERVRDRKGRVGENLVQNPFGSSNQLLGRYDLVNQPDAI